MLKYRQIWLVPALLCLVFIISGCSQERVKSVSINQVLHDKESIQSQSIFIYDEGEWFVHITTELPVDGDKPGNTLEEEVLQTATEELKQTFPSEELDESVLHKSFEMHVKHADIDVSDKNKVLIKGDNFSKTFDRDPSNPNRLIDEYGNEYEFNMEEK